MSKLRAPLKSCCNGCDAPPKPPSWVLCAKCLEGLTAQMQKILDEWPTPTEGTKEK